MDVLVMGGRPRKTWRDYVKADISKFGMSEIDPNDRLLWSKNLRPKMVQPPLRGTEAHCMVKLK